MMNPSLLGPSVASNPAKNDKTKPLITSLLTSVKDFLGLGYTRFRFGCPDDANTP
ncbi:hypothetical protein [Winogradskyella arenosi]|uniref:hypothetical protein n=1 Tax=Winogradskyella arenosi TaxID=533325 RepID=UPI001C694890|nr:hypothetical protein [Winogradskyella arenosi]